MAGEINKTFVISAVLVVVVLLCLLVWQQREECVPKVTYHPAGSKLETNPYGDAGYSEGFYSYESGRLAQKFKTRGEAISACVRNK